MAQGQKPFQLTLTREMLTALNAAQGASFTEDQLRDIAGGNIFSIALRGCAISLGYANDDKLFFLLLDGPFGEFSVHADDVTNLNDFRQTLQQAANFGHQVMIIKTPKNLIASVHVRPCECLCRKNQGSEFSTFDSKTDGKGNDSR